MRSLKRGRQIAGILLIAALLFLVLVIVGLSLTGRAISSNISPSSCSGYWSSCANAFADDSSRATASTKSSSKTGIWRNYNLIMPLSATIEKVYLRADFFANAKNGYLDIKVSNNGGLTYGPSHIIGGNTAEKAYLIDITNDRNWSVSSLNNENLIINVNCFKQGAGKNPLCYLDWLPINVSYTLFDFSLSITPSGNSASQGGTTTALISISSLGGISQPVSLSQTGCPTGAICSIGSSTGNPPFTSQLLISTSSSTSTGENLITIIGSSDGKTRSVGFILNVTSSSANETQNITLPPPTNTTNLSSNITCFDNDGGKSYYMAGIVRETNDTNSTIYYDTCKNSTTLNERYCTSDNRLSTEVFICPNTTCSFYSGIGAACAVPCIDSDGGKNYNTLGVLSGRYYYNQSDSCVDPVSLIEGYCSADGLPRQELYSCPSGCNEGICVEGNLQCSDSDGGKNYNVKGSATVTLESNSKTTDDICKNFTTLNEIYCGVDNKTVIETYNCPTNCYDGVCLDPSLTCIDSDGGSDYYVAGTTKIGDLNRSDFCWGDSRNLTEWYCAAPNKLAERYYNCPYGCPFFAYACKQQNDACVDTDGGKDYTVKGSVTLANSTRTDRCAIISTGLIVVEYYCASPDRILESYYNCNCVDGVCI